MADSSTAIAGILRSMSRKWTGPGAVKAAMRDFPVPGGPMRRIVLGTVVPPLAVPRLPNLDLETRIDEVLIQAGRAHITVRATAVHRTGRWGVAGPVICGSLVAPPSLTVFEGGVFQVLEEIVDLEIASARADAAEVLLEINTVDHPPALLRVRLAGGDERHVPDRFLDVQAQ